MKYIYLVFFLFLGSIFLLPSVSATEACIQVIQYAENTTTRECQAFPTPCDVPKGWTPVQECRLPEKSVTTPKFQVQKFASCEALESEVIDILERYQTRYYPYYAFRGDDIAALPSMISPPARSEVQSPSLAGSKATEPSPISTTNIQVLGVDEADSVKTDGKNIYTYSAESSEIRIVRTSDLTLVKTIKLPEIFSSIEIYLAGERLVLVGQKYSTSSAYSSARWYAPEMKTISLVYNIKDVSNPLLERYNQIDGNYRDSRVIGNTLYLVSTSDLRLPLLYRTGYDTSAEGFKKVISDVEKSFSIRRFAPEIRESLRNSKGKYLQSIRASVSSCRDVTFVLPDDETLKNVEFNPAFVSLSSVSLTDPTAKMKSELLFGDVSQIHMSKDALYITSAITQSSYTSSRCAPGTRCFSPSYNTITSTVVHKYGLINGSLSYQYSTNISGNPMTQYSMDEDAKGNFRIVTQNYAWSSTAGENSTELSVISPSGKVIGNLQDIAPGETFQSARFIGERLYLVTFEQIDPFFVIDLSTPTAPKILGELKIPGYSTYLHPYDADRLIGLGYDAKTNQWGGVQNGGLKIDLYNVKDVKNPKQEASLVLGDAGSSSEVLTSPRAFVWYKEKNLLLLPATLMKSANDPSDTYRSQSAFQGIVGVSILPSSISEKFRVSHIVLASDLEKEWKAQCAQYTGKKPTCQKLLDGSEYCGGSYSYVPPYCYAGSTVETYFASNMWNYQRDFITRALYVGDTFYSLSESGIRSWDFSNTTSAKASLTFPKGNTTKPIYPVPMMVR